MDEFSQSPPSLCLGKCSVCVVTVGLWAGNLLSGGKVLACFKGLMQSRLIRFLQGDLVGFLPSSGANWVL